MNIQNAQWPKKTIVLADDHRVVREGLRMLLESERDFSVVGEAGDGLTAVSLVSDLKPDVLLLDLMMPALDGQEVARRVRKCAPKTSVIVLSMHSSEPYVVSALRNGVVGYVLKDTGSADLIHAVREVIAGRRYLSPPLSERAIDAYQEKTKSVVWERYDMLTTRERETLKLLAEGHTNNEIASLLRIGPRTAETHRANLMRKLQLRNQTDLIKYSIEQGIIQIDKP